MAETRFKIGELIENRYRVLSVIGSGGMGTLYRVSDEARDGEIVALKTVMLDVPTAKAPESVERFQREFQILTQLRHPNLVSVYSYGIATGGELYFTMEWVQGQDLEHSIRQLEPAATIPVVIQICHALAYLHARGVIHGDLKPLNVLLMTGEQVKIVDFGVALEVRTPEVRARYYTPGYSAPEVKQQRPVDHRADLYSLGAIWYALLVGEPPLFMPGSERLIQFTLDEALEAQEQVPATVSVVITRLLATSPMDRYSSANEVIEAVNEATRSTYALETQETASSYALRVRFVNREAEMEMLQTEWEQAQSGEGKLVLVNGEAGVGKTRLVEELEVQAELEGGRVVWGQCVESGGSAYHPWREVLRVLIRYVEGADGADLQMERVEPVLATLLPELWERDYMAGAAPPAELDPQATQQRLHDTIAQVLRAAARLRPTIIVIEGGHWADEATLTLLSFLTRASGQAGSLVCVTYRDDEVSSEHPLVTLAGERVQHVKVKRLSPEATTDLARSMLGLEELPTLLTERLQRTTGGNAFFVQELIRSLAAEGEVLRRTVGGWQVDEEALREARLPESIRQVVWRRLEQLSAETQQVLRWAAIVGPVFWEGIVEEIGQVPRMQVQAALRGGLEQELVVERDESAFAGEREYLFNSSTVREVSYESVSRAERRGYHGRVAAWLMARSDVEVGEHLGLIANHLEKAGQTEQAVTYLHRAGEQAAAQFANAEAIAYFSHALDLTLEDERDQRYALLLAREKVYDLQGAREAQAQDLATLKELAEALADDRRRAEVALRRANYTAVTGDYPETIVAARTAIDLARATQDASKEAAGYVQWGLILWHQGDSDAARTQLEQALTTARAASLRQVEADSLRNLGSISLLFEHDYAGARIYFEQALYIYHEIGNQAGEGRTLGNLGVASTTLSDYAGARAYYERALQISREIGYRTGEGTVLSNLSRLFHHLGDDESAREYSQRALLTAQDIENRYVQGFALTNLGHALAGLGRLREAAASYRQAVDIRRELAEHNMAMESLAGLVRVSIAQGDLTQAQAHVEEILNHLENNTLGGTDDPFRIYLTCYRVLHANQDPRAQTVLHTAYHLLQERAARITDEELRRSFLENVPAHREIGREFARGRFVNDE